MLLWVSADGVKTSSCGKLGAGGDTMWSGGVRYDAAELGKKVLVGTWGNDSGGVVKGGELREELSGG